MRTHCPYCALQCATVLSPEADRVRVEPADFPVNRGRLCHKGWTAGELLATPDRLRAPLLRTDRSAPLRAVSWEEALEHVTERVRRLWARHGHDAVAVFGSGALTNEKAYLLGKFARVALGTSRIDYNGRFCMSSAAAAGTAAFGVDRGLPFPVTDLGGADVVLLAGANPAETMPPLMQHLDAARLVVVDPRRTATAERAALHLQPAPGTDLALALGLFHTAVVEGFLDTAYVHERTSGFERAWQLASGWWPERVERTTGVPAESQREVVRLLAAADNAYVLTGRGVEQHSTGTDTAAAFVNLALALGLPGRAGSGYGCLTGQGNGQGGREHGQKADQLPGYRSITDPAAREHVARHWGVRADDLPGPGPSAVELLSGLGTEGGARALLVFGSNPVVSAPDSARVTERLRALDLLVVTDFVPSETAAEADVVLPVAQWAEEDGTMTNLDGRVLRRRAAVAPPEGVRTDLEVLRELAVRLGQPAAAFPSAPAEVFEELRRCSSGGAADYSGISYERLDDGENPHWPCPEGGSSTPRMFLAGFAHPDGRARFAAVEPRDVPEVPDADFPLYATTGRVLAHYQTGAQTRRVAELAAVLPEAHVETHPDTARRCGLTDGARAWVSSRRGGSLVRVRTTETIRPDTVFVPFHFSGQACANLFTSPALDPTSRMPEFKTCAVRLVPEEESCAGS
ncbi:nitrite reductase [Actinopolyspora erythraea]|nr:molybdopterin oxidoreductase family protein [Actinopolyspora erythraea]ASU79005.1 nitrite reductase [Actinopolyspora erythraea]